MYNREKKEKEKMENEIKYIGIANSWTSKDKTPQEFKDHQQNCKWEDMKSVKLGRCYQRVTCNKCKISYEVDSSD